MPSGQFFSRLGVFVAKGFLDAHLSCSVRDEAALSPTERVGVYDAGHKVDLTQRRTGASLVSAGTLALITDRLMAIKPAVERHFRVMLEDCQPPRVLVYEPGDFFNVHVDVGGPGRPSHIRERLVSVVVFLNDASDTPKPDRYTGGSLTFYNLIDDERFKSCGLPLTGQAGMLVAFRADVPHAVTPVISGRRFTIVTWFC